MTAQVVAFPGVDLRKVMEESQPSTLGDWFNTITDRVDGVPLDHAVVILMDKYGEQIVYCLNDIRKDQMLGMLHIAAEQALYGGVAP